MRFAGGTLENFWQMSARDYDERMQKLTPLFYEVAEFLQMSEE
jgi:hypothetical protein